jgi:hypothetical protein
MWRRALSVTVLREALLMFLIRSTCLFVSSVVRTTPAGFVSGQPGVLFFVLTVGPSGLVYDPNMLGCKCP